MNIHLSDVGLKMFDQARKRKGWNKYDTRWYIEADISKATLWRFWSQHPIRASNFMRLCEIVGIDDWQSLVEWSE